MLMKIKDNKTVKKEEEKAEMKIVLVEVVKNIKNVAEDSLEVTMLKDTRI